MDKIKGSRDIAPLLQYSNETGTIIGGIEISRDMLCL